MPLKQVDWDQRLDPLKWAVEKTFLCGVLNFLASLPGQGKTALLTYLLWQASRPNGGWFLGHKVMPCTSIYADYDAPGDGRNMRFWFQQHKAAYPDGDLSKIIVLEPDADTYGLSEPELVELTRIAKERRVGMVVVDSFMAAFPGADPVKLTAVQPPLWYLRRLATELMAAVILIDHLPKPVMGEKAGARGVMGSVAKPAQARVVHLLTRVPPKEVEGRHVLRWENHKMSYAALLEPFGVALRFDSGAVFVDPAELPEGYNETRIEKALRAMKDHLEAKRGIVVDRKDLLGVACTAANIKDSTAKKALNALRLELADALEEEKLPGQGNPVGFRLKPEDATLSDQITQEGETPSETEESFGHTPLTECPKSDPNPDAAEDVAFEDDAELEEVVI